VSILLVALILLIGFSRIYLRVHYTSDVVAGFLIGFIWLLISLFVIGKAEQYSKNNTLIGNGVNLNAPNFFQLTPDF
jgi:membrane-associated phospholipid phosphatase